MSDDRHPYSGRTAVLATIHRKEEAIAPAFISRLGLIVEPAQGIDTDQLGTFSGEISREGTMLEVALRKARLGMSASGSLLGIASEGTFGPHPVIPMLSAGIELLVFVDDEMGIIVTEGFVAENTNFDYLVVSPGELPNDFLHRIGFPGHGLIVRANEKGGATGLTKGVVDLDVLKRAIAEAAGASSDGCARLETDMRAHFNPTRMSSLAELAGRLAQRLARQCPACSSPGFGRTGTQPGLLCEDCGEPTEMIAAEIFGCPSCNCSEERPRADRLEFAPARFCSWCNP